MALNTGMQRTQLVLTYIKSKIASQAEGWQIGDRLPSEVDLMQTVGVGRSNVRQAIGQLGEIGILESLPGQGTFVRSMIPTRSPLNDYMHLFEVEEILSYRRALQIEAAQQAALNRTDEDLYSLAKHLRNEDGCGYCPIMTAGRARSPFENHFHTEIFVVSKNRLLLALFQGANEHLRRLSYRGRLVNLIPATAMREDHELILEAIRQQHSLEAGLLMDYHSTRDLGILDAATDIAKPAMSRSEEETARFKAQIDEIAARYRQKN